MTGEDAVQVKEGTEQPGAVVGWLADVWEGFVNLPAHEQVLWFAGAMIPIGGVVWASWKLASRRGTKTSPLPQQSPAPTASSVLGGYVDLDPEDRKIVLAGIEGVEKAQPPPGETRETVEAAAKEARAGKLEDILEIAEESYRDAAVAAGSAEQTADNARRRKAEAALNLGSILVATDSGRAYALFREVTELDPDNFRAWIERGRLAQVCGDTRDMLDSNQQALLVARRNDENRETAVAESAIADHAVSTGNLPLAVGHYQNVSAALERRAAASPDDAERQRDLSVSYDRIGDVGMAQGDLVGALKAYTDALAIREILAARDANNMDWQRDLGVSHKKIGEVKMAQGDLAGALKAYKDGLMIAETLAARDADNTEWQRDLSVSHNKIGEVKMAQGDLAGALKAYTDALAIAETLAARDADNTNWQRDLSVSNERLGDVKLAQGDNSGALEEYLKSLNRMMPLRDRDRTNTDLQRFTSVTSEKIGNVKMAQGDLAGALKAYTDALAIRETLAARDADNTDWQRDLIVSHVKLAEAGDNPRGHLTKALAIAEAMDAAGTLTPADAWMPDDLRRRLAAVDENP